MPRVVNTYENAQRQGRLWTPARIPSLLEGWYDPGDETTMTVGATGCTGLNDKSPKLRHLTSVAGEPLITTFGTKRGIIGSKSSVSYLQRTGVSVALPSTLITIAKVPSSTTGVLVNVGSNTTGSGGCAMGHGLANADSGSNGNRMVCLYSFIKWNVYTSLNIGGNTTTMSWSYATGKGRGTNFAEQTVSSASLAAQLPATVISLLSTVAGGRITDSTIGCSLILNVNTPDIVFKAEGYVAWDRGLQETLAQNHPYRNRPPLIGD